jgi:heme-degrading monooxygenase HmoA
MIADTPEPPYWAVIFTSTKTETEDGYAAMADAMDRLAAEQPGYLGMDSAKQDVGITVSYWRDLDSIAAWKANLKHLTAQAKGRDTWYQAYTVRIARVERDYRFERER